MAQIALPAAGSNVVTSGPAHKVILKLALPTMAAMLSQSVVNEIDIVFFAKLPQPESTNAQAALLPSLIVLWLFGGSLSAISVGTQAYTARRFAEQKHEDAGAVLANAVLFSVVAGILFTVLGYLAMPFMVGKLLHTEGPRLAATQYLSWRLLGITSMVTTFAFKAFFDGIGKTHIHLISAIVMNAVNIILCLLFIFGNPGLGIAKMGIAGAGMAGCISTYLGLAIMVGYALKGEYRNKFKPFTFSKVDKGLLGSLLKLSIPSAVATIAIMTGFGLFSAIASQLDKIAQAANPDIESANAAATTVIVGVLKLTFTACLAFGTSTATLVAQSLGEKNGDKAEHFGWTSVKLGAAIFGAVGFAEAIFAPQVLSIATHSTLVAAAAVGPMRVMGFCTPLIALGMILTQALFGAGNTKFVMIVELILHFTCLVPLAYLLGIVLGFGLMGIWGAGVVYVVLLAGVMSYKFRSGDWKTITI